MGQPQQGVGRGIGILGGTFDPPHIGHLILGEWAREQLQLEKVLFLPAGQPPHKREDPVSSAAHRLAMTQLAVQDNRSFRSSRIDVERPPPHYTSSLRPLLEARFPNRELWLLIGGDSLRDLPLWHEPQKIVEEWRMAVLPRPGAEYDWSELEQAVPGVRESCKILDGPSVAVSSTQIRRWRASHRSLRYVLPQPVLEYIERHNLYR